jgi:hypothetical protein
MHDTGEIEVAQSPDRLGVEAVALEIPRPFIGPDPEYLPENLPPREPYYWEEQEATGGPSRRPWWQKAYHCVSFYGEKALNIGEMLGEMIANVLGLTESRFQYVVDALEYDRWKAEQALREEEERNTIAAMAEEEEEASRRALEQAQQEVPAVSGTNGV